jgi:hypothetical protein
MILRTKVLLGAAVLMLATGLIVSLDIIVKPPNAPAAYVLLPVGAILFGLFLMSRMLEKESMRYDEERHEAEAMVERGSGSGTLTKTAAGAKRTGKEPLAQGEEERGESQTS